MRRRVFLKALALFGLAGGSLASAQSAPVLRRRFIDAHCHVYNSRDLPVEGFIRRVALRDYVEMESRKNPQLFRIFRAAGLDVVSIAKGLAAHIAEMILHAGAPDPNEEIQLICASSDCGAIAPTPAPGQGTPAASAREDTAAHEQLLRQTLESAGRTPDDADDRNAFVDALLSEMKQARRVEPSANALMVRTEPSASPRLVSWMADFLGGDSIFSRVFEWKNLITSFRSQIIKTYISLYETEQRQIVLMTPALLDLNYWLDNPDDHDHVASLSDQIRVMEILSLRAARPLHCFAPFDPARNIFEQGSSLKTVKDAVENRGFLGVKLYPPMGYRPSGNAGKRDYPPHLQGDDPEFGQKLDRELFGLYAWCEEAEVPILTHATDTEGANVNFSKRAAPEFWQAVLEKHPNLRVNLGHFGHFRQIQDRAYALDLFSQTWEAQFANLINDNRFPYIYADLSYFIWIMGRNDRTTVAAVKRLLGRFLETSPNATQRLLYGTDWSMTAHAKGFEAYFELMEEFLRDLGLDDAALDRIFHTNAIRFLGLEPNRQAFARLKVFYEKHGKAMPEFA